MPLNNAQKLKSFRRELRSALTPAEVRLWGVLRNSQLAGRKFRRQHPFGRFILDFFYEERRLAVELDGGQHFDAAKQRYDERRSAFIREYRITVVRFSNDQVMRERWAVLEEIARALGVAT